MANHLHALKNVLDMIANARTHGVSYVVELDSHKAGPNVGIIACTHGN